MANSEKLSDPERGLSANNEQETAFNQEDESTRFIEAGSEGDGRNGELVKQEGEKAAADEFYGLTREDLEKYASDPKWVKIRWILFIIFVICWAAMLIAAIVIVVLTPKCPPVPDLSWYQSGLMYQLDVEKFQDSDGNGIGDINGVTSQEGHFSDLNVKAVWLSSNFVDATDKTKPDARFGTVEDLTTMTDKLKKKGIRTMMTLDGVADMDNTAATELLRVWGNAGIEGFVVDQSTANQSGIIELINELQKVLDEEYNKRDDRERSVIGGLTLSLNAELPAAVYLPPAPSNCTGVECNTQRLENIGEANNQDPWKITQVSWDSPLANIVLKLTMPGTPNVLYGDEIGVIGDLASRGTMNWNDDLSNEPHSVLAQKAVGYDQTSMYDLFKELSTLRTTESSLRWGNMQVQTGSDVLIFYRDAQDFPPVLIAVNPSKNGFASEMSLDKEHTVGEVLVSTIADLPVGESFDTTAIYLPSESVLVARLSKPETK